MNNKKKSIYSLLIFGITILGVVGANEGKFFVTKGDSENIFEKEQVVIGLDGHWVYLPGGGKIWIGDGKPPEWN